METIPANSQLARLLDWCHDQGASDLHAREGHPYVIRVDGRLSDIPDGVSPAPDTQTIRSLLSEAFLPPTAARILDSREVDLSCNCGERRYRVNFSKQQARQSFSFRAVPQQTMRLADLQLPLSLLDIVRELRGLILLTGPTGQGKSTTARALLEEINQTRKARIISIEDPIEYVFTDAESHFEQREVGIDTASFADGIRNAMRQDPNILFIGEIRDRESIFAALQAAETGHLVLTTLHADSVSQAIGRLCEHYPAAEQDNIASLLARNLKAVVCQRLLPNLGGSRTPCLEVMRRDAGVQEAIRTRQLERLPGIVEASVGQGMHSFDQYLVELLSGRIVAESIAREYAVNRHRLDLMLRGIEQPAGILAPDRR